MMLDRIRNILSKRSIVTAGLLMIALAVALLLGQWLTVLQAPLNRHTVARQLMENGAADQAAHVFETPIWQGVALYRAGRYHRAAGAFFADESVTGLYNLGNAYAHLGLYQGAITAYEAVLQRRPGHEDARFNLDLVRQAATRERELEEESRETENAGQWEDGLQDSEDQGDPEASEGDQAGDGENAEQSEQAQSQGGDQEDQEGASETSTPESTIAGEAAGGSEQESEISEAPVFSLSGRDDEDADDLSPEGEAPEDAVVIGGVIDRDREEALADEIVLRRIRDDPAVVLKARLNMALRKQRAAR